MCKILQVVIETLDIFCYLIGLHDTVLVNVNAKWCSGVAYGESENNSFDLSPLTR